MRTSVESRTATRALHAYLISWVTHHRAKEQRREFLRITAPILKFVKYLGRPKDILTVRFRFLCMSLRSPLLYSPSARSCQLFTIFGKNIPVCFACVANFSPNSCVRKDSSRRAFQ